MVSSEDAGSAGGWSGGRLERRRHWQSNLRPNSLKRSTDGWDDDELGSVYNHRVVDAAVQVHRAVPRAGCCWR